MLEEIHDEFDNSTTGYSFLNNHKNQLVLKKSKEVTKQMCARLSYNDHENTKSWLKKSSDLLEIILFLIHTSYGLPARGTELNTLLYKNEKGNHRNVFVAKATVLIAIRYNKNSHVFGDQKAIYSFVPSSVGCCILKYLVLIRPAQELFKSHILNLPPNGMLFQKFDNASMWHDDHISSIFPKRLLEYSKVNLLFSNFRQSNCISATTKL
jgi:hypothetical protein